MRLSLTSSRSSVGILSSKVTRNVDGSLKYTPHLSSNFHENIAGCLRCAAIKIQRIRVIHAVEDAVQMSSIDDTMLASAGERVRPSKESHKLLRKEKTILKINWHDKEDPAQEMESLMNN